MKEGARLQKFGFQSIDEDKELKASHPPTRVNFDGENLMDLKANKFPSQLGRSLRINIFGNNGLTEDMIDNSKSPVRSEAPIEETMKFKGICFLKSASINLSN